MLASRQAQCLCAAALLCLGAVVVLPVASMLPSAAQQSPAPAAAPVPFAPASTPEQERLRILAAKGYPGTVHVLHVKSGDTILFETMMHSHNQIVPGTTIDQIKKLRTDYPGRGPHTLTGPVYIEGAEPGDVLKVTINKIVPRAYAANFNVPGMFGEFPNIYQDGQVKYLYLDWDKKLTEFLPGIQIPLKPFPGIL